MPQDKLLSALGYTTEPRAGAVVQGALSGNSAIANTLEAPGLIMSTVSCMPATTAAAALKSNMEAQQYNTATEH